MSRAGVTQAVRAALIRSASRDRASVYGEGVVSMFGVTAGVAYELDPIETARRDLAGLGAVPRPDVLEVLMGLPLGLPVAVADLSRQEMVLLRDAPRGMIDLKGGYVTRRAVRPAAATLAVVAARSWRDGMVSAGRFAPFCARMVLLSSPPTDLDQLRTQASFYGIGICTFAAGTLQTLVEPEPYVRHRHSTAQWWFAEELYRQVLGQQIADLGSTTR